MTMQTLRICGVRVCVCVCVTWLTRASECYPSCASQNQGLKVSRGLEMPGASVSDVPLPSPVPHPTTAALADRPVRGAGRAAGALGAATAAV